MKKEKVSYKKVIEYLKELAEKNTEISDAVGFNQSELLNKLRSRDGIDGYILAPFEYQGAISGTSQQTFASRVVQFAILTVHKAKENYEAEIDIESNCESIGLEILSRIRYDAEQAEEIKWLYQNIDPNKMTFHPIGSQTTEAIKGFLFSFELKTREVLKVHHDKWSDL